MYRNPLNSKEVNGNAFMWMQDQIRENAASHEDTYKCDCGLTVPEKEWDYVQQCCFLCAEDDL